MCLPALVTLIPVDIVSSIYGWEKTAGVIGGFLIIMLVFAIIGFIQALASPPTTSEENRERRAAMRREANDRQRPSSADWRRARAAALQRDRYRCVKCGRAAEEVDHIIPRAMGGPVYNLTNLQSMCKPCHKRKTAGQAGQIRRYMRGE